jgi:hypothetical protein
VFVRTSSHGNVRAAMACAIQPRDDRVQVVLPGGKAASVRKTRVTQVCTSTSDSCCTLSDSGADVQTSSRAAEAKRGRLPPKRVAMLTLHPVLCAFAH